MDTKIIFLTAIMLLALLVAGCAQNPQPAQQTGSTDNGLTGNTSTPKTYTIEITDSGYVPQKVTVKQGDTITWLSKATTREDWPASAQHPTHTKYPGSGIEKCGTEQESSIFDSCKALSEGKSYSFTFNEKGTSWAYHDHVAAKTFGQIVVE